jgi:NitT/TauT family transport system substrate-binding protein
MKRVLLEAFLDRHNIPVDKLNLISVAKEAEKSIFINGKVDAVLGLLPTEEIKYREIGLDFDWFLLSDYGVKMMQNSLITNISTIDSNPDLVRRLVKATSKSLKYAVKNPFLADRALAEKYPETIRGAFQKAVPFIESDIFDKKGYGYMEIDDWRETQKILLKSGQLKNAQKLSDVYTNEFLN